MYIHKYICSFVIYAVKLNIPNAEFLKYAINHECTYVDFTQNLSLCVRVVCVHVHVCVM